MTTLDVEVQGLSGSNYVIRRGRAVVAEVDGRVFSESAEVAVDGETHTFRRERLGRAFTVAAPGGGEVARAEREGMVSGTWVLHVDGRRFELRRASMFSRGLDLTEHGARVGSVRPKGAFRRGATSDLPDDLPVVAQVLAVFVALTVWRRRNAAGAGSSG